jgi:hypothetical protein
MILGWLFVCMRHVGKEIDMTKPDSTQLLIIDIPESLKVTKRMGRVNAGRAKGDGLPIRLEDLRCLIKILS